MNNGDADTWSKLTKKRSEEVDVFDYLPIEEIEEDNLENYEDTKDSKGRMTPVEDFTMHIYAHGKLVTLERNYREELYGLHENILGINVLLRKGKVSGYSEFPIILYLPKGSDEFVIIRK